MRLFFNKMVIFKKFLPVFLFSILIIIFYLINKSILRPNYYIKWSVTKENNEFVSEEIIISTAACGHDIYNVSIALLKSVATLSKSRLHFIILTDVLKDNITEEFNKWPEIYKRRIKLEIIKPYFPNNEWKDMFAECSTARLFLPELLQNVDSLIYIDVDTVFLSPVEELWEYFSHMNSTHMLGIVRESYHKDYGWFHDWGHQMYKDIPFVRPVPFNAGVLLMNLTRLRSYNWKTKLTDYFRKYKKVLSMTADQGLINIFMNKSMGSFIEIPCHWNYIDEHCIFGSHLCESAQISGIGLFHHHSMYKNREQSSYSVYKALNQFSIANDSIENAIKHLEKDIQIKSKCQKLHKIFGIGVERFTLKTKNKV